MNTLLTIIAFCIFVIVFLYLSSWLSSTETAITNLSNRRLAILRQRQGRNVDYLLQLKKRLPRTLITLLIANNIVNILLSSLTALISNKIFHATGVSIAIGTVTFMLILFGEIVPKSKAIHQSLKISQKRARTLYYLNKILMPAVFIFRWLSKVILRITGTEWQQHAPLISDESIISMTSLAESEGVVKPIEKQLIEHVFIFGDQKVKDVMIPMQDVFTLNVDDNLETVLEAISQKGFSRIPVIDDDKIKGILYAKDLSCREKNVLVKKVMRKPHYSEIDQDITVLFDEMRSNHYHLSIVLDHQKNPSGIITMEDILEELVGDIEDEYDSNPKKNRT